MLANPTETALSTELAEAVDRARDFAKASKAAATHKAYAADLRDFAAYCQRIGALSLPADPAVVGTYLATIAETKSVATIRRRMVAIAQAHKDAGAPNPVAHRDVQKVLAGIVRTKTVAQTRKDALTKDRLEEAVKALGSDLKGQRDRALLLLTFACAMRRAEAAALDVADLRYDAHGLVVTLRRSKTDQEGQGREIGGRSSRMAACAPQLTFGNGSTPRTSPTARSSARSTAAGNSPKTASRQSTSRDL
jgi:integrase